MLGSHTSTISIMNDNYIPPIPLLMSVAFDIERFTSDRPHVELDDIEVIIKTGLLAVTRNGGLAPIHFRLDAVNLTSSCPICTGLPTIEDRCVHH